MSFSRKDVGAMLIRRMKRIGRSNKQNRLNNVDGIITFWKEQTASRWINESDASRSLVVLLFPLYCTACLHLFRQKCPIYEKSSKKVKQIILQYSVDDTILGHGADLLYIYTVQHYCNVIECLK